MSSTLKTKEQPKDRTLLHAEQLPIFTLNLTLLWGGVIGLIIGSFLSMLSWRLPRLLMAQWSKAALESSQTEDQANSHFESRSPSILAQLSTGGSKCPKCKTRLKWYQLIPLLSWLGSAGKCLHCKRKIAWRYPLIELFSALSTILILWQFGLTPIGISALAFNYLLITISVIDLEHQLILDSLSYPLLWLGLLVNTQSWFVPLEQAVWGAAIGYLLLWSIFHGYRLVTGKEGMGYGDFKLLAALGAWFGIFALAQIILIAAISSIVVGLFAIIINRHQYNQPMAFAPFLALSGWATLFLGTSSGF